VSVTAPDGGGRLVELGHVIRAGMVTYPGLPGPAITPHLTRDDNADLERPAHTILLAAGIPVVEHLTGLEQLPPTGAAFTAVPLRIEGLGTIPVRAFARLPLPD
jgi:kynurenine formamidase